MLIERHHKAVIDATAKAHAAEMRLGAAQSAAQSAGRGAGRGAGQSPGAARRGSASDAPAPRDTPQKLSEVVSHLERRLQMEWAAELSEVKQGLAMTESRPNPNPNPNPDPDPNPNQVKQGLGVTRLIFNTDRSEDGTCRRRSVGLLLRPTYYGPTYYGPTYYGLLTTAYLLRPYLLRPYLPLLLHVQGSSSTTCSPRCR